MNRLVTASPSKRRGLLDSARSREVKSMTWQVQLGAALQACACSLVAQLDRSLWPVTGFCHAYVVPQQWHLAIERPGSTRWLAPLRQPGAEREQFLVDFTEKLVESAARWSRQAQAQLDQSGPETTSRDRPEPDSETEGCGSRAGVGNNC